MSCKTDARHFCGNVLAVIVLVSLLIALFNDVHPNPGPVIESYDTSICHSNVRSLKALDRLLHIKLELANKFDIITLSG